MKSFLVQAIDVMRLAAASLAILSLAMSLFWTQVVKALLRMKWPAMPDEVIWMVSAFVTGAFYAGFCHFVRIDIHDLVVAGYGVLAGIGGPYLVRWLKYRHGISINEKMGFGAGPGGPPAGGAL